MPFEDIILERLNRLEKVVYDVSGKLDRLIDGGKPESPIPHHTTSKRRMSDTTEDSTGYRPTTGSWVRIYSKHRNEHFLYHSKTEKVLRARELLFYPIVTPWLVYYLNFIYCRTFLLITIYMCIRFITYICLFICEYR
jgi:hypothetical protein